MEEKRSFLEPVVSFCNEFGWGFIMLIGSGLLIALLIEVIIKNSAKWLEGKWEGHDRLLSLLDGAKIAAVQVCAWVLSVWFAQLVCRVLALPGGDALLPLWVSLVYLCQYVFSCWGIKGLLEALKVKAEKPRKEKAPKRDPLEGLQKLSDVLYTDGQGNYYNRKGRKVKV